MKSTTIIIILISLFVIMIIAAIILVNIKPKQPVTGTSTQPTSTSTSIQKGSTSGLGSLLSGLFGKLFQKKCSDKDTFTCDPNKEGYNMCGEKALWCE